MLTTICSNYYCWLQIVSTISSFSISVDELWAIPNLSGSLRLALSLPDLAPSGNGTNPSDLPDLRRSWGMFGATGHDPMWRRTDREHLGGGVLMSPWDLHRTAPYYLMPGKHNGSMAKLGCRCGSFADIPFFFMSLEYANCLESPKPRIIKWYQVYEDYKWTPEQRYTLSFLMGWRMTWKTSTLQTREADPPQCQGVCHSHIDGQNCWGFSDLCTIDRSIESVATGTLSLRVTWLFAIFEGFHSDWWKPVRSHHGGSWLVAMWTCPRNDSKLGHQYLAVKIQQVSQHAVGCFPFRLEHRMLVCWNRHFCKPLGTVLVVSPKCNTKCGKW